MRQILYCIICLVAFTSCQKVVVPTYSGEEYVQFVGKNGVDVNKVFSFVYSGSNAVRDTLFIDMEIIGPTKDYNRKVTLKQIKQYTTEYSYDSDGTKIDSVLVEKENQAIPGLHYVPFDTPEAQNLLFVQADTNKFQIGIILLRDISLKEAAVNLSIKVLSNEDILAGDTKFLVRRIDISDVLIRPVGWNKDSGQHAKPNSSVWWGEWGPVKHQFMIDVSPAGERWDAEFLAELNKDFSLAYWYCRHFRKELDRLNKQRAAEDLPPLCENPEDISTKIEFV